MDRMSSIELAIKNETSEMAFYLDEARRSTNPVARKLFETLAGDEKEHMERLRGLHEKLLADGSWPEDVAIEVADTNIKAALEGLGKRDDATARHDDDIGALNKGVELEHMLSIKDSLFYLEDPEGWLEEQERQGLDGA